MEKLLERQKVPKRTQEKTENPNRPLTSEEIELVVLKFPIKKNSGPDNCIDECYQTFKSYTSPLQTIPKCGREYNTSHLI